MTTDITAICYSRLALAFEVGSHVTAAFEYAGHWIAYTHTCTLKLLSCVNWVRIPQQMVAAKKFNALPSRPCSKTDTIDCGGIADVFHTSIKND